MSFEETLAILHGWLGAELEVAVRGKEGRVVANVAGRLAAGSDLSARGHAGPIFFQLGVVGRSGFFLAEEDFRAARWVGREETLLAVRVGEIELLIDSGA